MNCNTDKAADRLQAACADPDGPLYGSDMVPLVGDLIEAAEDVVATAFGNVSGLSEADQLVALRAAAAELRRAINGTATCETCEGAGRILDHNKWRVDRGKWMRSFDEEIGVECPECNGEAEL
jgi:hypothetical protein